MTDSLWWADKINEVRAKVAKWGGLDRVKFSGRATLVQAYYYGRMRYWAYSLRSALRNLTIKKLRQEFGREALRNYGKPVSGFLTPGAQRGSHSLWAGGWMTHPVHDESMITRKGIKEEHDLSPTRPENRTRTVKHRAVRDH